MIKANIEAQIEAKQKIIDNQIRPEIDKLDKIIASIKYARHKLLDKEAELSWEIKELMDQLEEDEV